VYETVNCCSFDTVPEPHRWKWLTVVLVEALLTLSLLCLVLGVSRSFRSACVKVTRHPVARSVMKLRSVIDNNLTTVN